MIESNPAFPIFEVLSPGVGLSFQDLGRPCWRRFGIPPGGAMDRRAAIWANYLLENPPGRPVLELLLQGAAFKVVQNAWIAITGADATASHPLWKTIFLRRGDTLRFSANRKGIWTYVAIAGGWDAPHYLESASVYARGGFGAPLRQGDLIGAEHSHDYQPPSWQGARMISFDERPDYNHPPAIPLYRGPQWSLFSEHDREVFFSTEWLVSSRSDRSGYRLEGPTFVTNSSTLESEPVLTGSIQIPDGGAPIVTMPDGPTVGGYPKLGLVDPDYLYLLAQCRPGTAVRFKEIEESYEAAGS